MEFAGLTTEETLVLVDILDMHLQGMSDAKDMMTKDTDTLCDFDVFNEVMGDAIELEQMVKNIRKKVIDAYVDSTYGGSDAAAGTIRALLQRVQGYAHRSKGHLKRRR